MLKQVHAYVHGDVIGVGFRAWTKIQAKVLSLKGWVKNVYDRPDRFGNSGGVEAVFQGEEEKLKKMIVFIKEGPPVSMVSSADIFFEDPKEIFDTFEIKR